MLAHLQAETDLPSADLLITAVAFSPSSLSVLSYFLFCSRLATSDIVAAVVWERHQQTQAGVSLSPLPETFPQV